MIDIRADYSASFTGKCILVVEDEYFLADETRRKLEKLGAVVVGPTGRVGEALSLIALEAIDAAILDIQLDGETAFPIAEKLEALGIPYVFASGYNASIVPDKFKGKVFNKKPVDLEHFAQALLDSPKANG